MGGAFSLCSLAPPLTKRDLHCKSLFIFEPESTSVHLEVLFFIGKKVV